jgi:cysteinylglycine-S-conjugate dipeptidase
MHSGMFGGPAPDALLALCRMLATLRDARGNTTIMGIDSQPTWPGVDYPAEQIRADARVLPGSTCSAQGRWRTCSGPGRLSPYWVSTARP